MSDLVGHPEDRFSHNEAHSQARAGPEEFFSCKSESESDITKTRSYNITGVKIFIFRRKIVIFSFNIFAAQNIDCGYTLEPSHSNEYPQSMF